MAPVTGRFPEGSRVLTRFPLTPEQEACDRSAWPWVPGTIIGQVAADEWDVVIEIPELATPEDDTPAPPGTACTSPSASGTAPRSGAVRPGKPQRNAPVTITGGGAVAVFGSAAGCASRTQRVNACQPARCQGSAACSPSQAARYASASSAASGTPRLATARITSRARQ